MSNHNKNLRLHKVYSLEKQPKTIFGEQVHVGDKIMYMYKSYGDYKWCFGEVLEITHKEYVAWAYIPYKLKVRRVHVLNGYDEGPCDMVVYLTNPAMMKVGTTIKIPS